MPRLITIPLIGAIGAASALPSAAAELAIRLQLPEAGTSEYQRPYLAVWVERPDDTFVSTLAVWHMVKDKRGNANMRGDRYLNALRNWWRQSGTTSQMPIDGLSSATRSAGTHELLFQQGVAPLGNLAPGRYELVIEAVRELKGPRPPAAPPGPPANEGLYGRRGGRGPSRDSLELVRVEFDWPVRTATTIKARGKSELGAVTLDLKP
jgi:hypothetical protein